MRNEKPPPYKYVSCAGGIPSPWLEVPGDFLMTEPKG
jgi:hypothetical protein